MALRFSTAQYGFALMGGFLIVALILTASLAYFDVVIHNFYILPEQKNCWDTKSTNPICIEVYQKTGVPVGDNADLPNAYWKMLNTFVLIVGGVVSAIWLMMTFVLSRMNGEYPDFHNIYFAIIIGATIAVLPMTSFGDYFYFIILGVNLPLNWSWLDHSGLFPAILSITGDSDVTLNDLYIAMGTGIGIVVLLWTPIIHAFATSRKNSVSELIYQE